MEESGGLWLGWSGKTTHRRPDSTPKVSSFGTVELATIDLSEDEVSLYYTGFANRTLWPLFHSFPGRVVIRHDTYRAYRRINRRFAEALYPMLKPGDLVWVHDYQLFHVGQELRQLGWRGKLGFFLHIPFPPADIFSILTWSRQFLEAILHYDLVGVHTQRYADNLVDTLSYELGGEYYRGVFTHGRLSSRIGAYHIGIDPSTFNQPFTPGTRALKETLAISDQADHRLILGVDRLDYTKGIPERLLAFERLLDNHRSLVGKLTFVQISSPSRTRVPEYIREKERVERLVGQINGRFSETGYVPIRYLYRSYTQEELARFYHDSDVGMITPLRDGMNLVSMEYIAAQAPDNPGVLVLSQFSGAASVLSDVLQVNPYDIEGTAEATYRALSMTKEERQRRWRISMDQVLNQTARTWSESFRKDLVSVNVRSATAAD
jgi:trehalose 6-phosphate synthase